MTGSRRSFLATAAAGAAAVGTAASAARPSNSVPLLGTYVANAGRYLGRRSYPSLLPDDRLVLLREPGNDYDPRAVSVWSTNGRKLGYVPRVANEALANLMDAGFDLDAHVTDMRWSGRRPEIRLDISLRGVV